MGAIPPIPPTQPRQLLRREARQILRPTTEERAAPIRSSEMTKHRLKIKLRLREKAAWRSRVSALKQKQALENHIALQQEDACNEDGKKHAIENKDVRGLKYLELVAPLLERLHEDGCTRDTAGNRTLHYDQYCMLVLLHLFNPTITSLRGLDQASKLDKVQKQLGCSRATASSMSESSGIFNADRLKAIIAEIGAEAHTIGQHKSLQEKIWGQKIWGQKIWGQKIWGQKIWGQKIWGQKIWGQKIWGQKSGDRALFKVLTCRSPGGMMIGLSFLRSKLMR